MTTELLHDGRGRRLYLTAEERRAFLAAAATASHPARTLCGVLTYTGCRVSEALQLTPRRARLAFAVALMLAGSVACAGPRAAQRQALGGDPLEPFNRAMFEVNRVLDGMFVKPAAILYRLLVPRLVRHGIGNALLNLASPVTLANDLLQGDLRQAGVTLGRFAVNSTVGLAGLVDVGSRIGLPYHFEDFGQTLAVHGVGSGPYLMLPLLGPTNPRDLVGDAVDIFFTPLTYVAPLDVRLGVKGAQIVDLREETLDELDELERTSLDYYVAVRTAYQQFRAAEIHEDALPTEELYEDIYDLDEPLEEAPAGVDAYEDPAGDIYQDPAEGP